MIQGRIPGIQEIFSKVITRQEVDLEDISIKIQFEYHEDGFNIKSMKYGM